MQTITADQHVERRYEVFISSTYEDLKNSRDAIIKRTTKSGHFPCGMEMFSTGGVSDVEKIEKCIAKADIFVILVGAVYGSEIKGLEATGQDITPEHFISFEYDLAEKYEKPILAFLFDDIVYKRERGKFPEGHHEREHDRDLREFRERVMRNKKGFGRIVEFFDPEKGADSLVAQYEHALQGQVQEMQEKGGWVRGEVYDDLKGTTRLDRMVAQNPFFRRFVERLNDFDVLSGRCAEKVPYLKRRIADYFLDRYLAKFIDSNRRHIFFESGSSIGFVSEAFIDKLRQEEWLRKVSLELLIQTNNILTYLDFVLSEHIRVELYPYGPPEAKYGATFGDLTGVPMREPPAAPRRLAASARPAVDKIRDEMAERYKDHGIAIMTASGVDTSEGSVFPGPHGTCQWV